MKRLTKAGKSIYDSLRWIFMSPKQRYAYLWTKTKKLNEIGHTFNNGVATSQV